MREETAMPEQGPQTGRRAAPVPTKGRPTLSGVLREFENARRDVTLAEVARKLGIERSALDGMIQLLVRKGRLREVVGGPADEATPAVDVDPAPPAEPELVPPTLLSSASIPIPETALVANTGYPSRR